MPCFMLTDADGECGCISCNVQMKGLALWPVRIIIIYYHGERLGVANRCCVNVTVRLPSVMRYQSIACM